MVKALYFISMLGAGEGFRVVKRSANEIASSANETALKPDDSQSTSTPATLRVCEQEGGKCGPSSGAVCDQDRCCSTTGFCNGCNPVGGEGDKAEGLQAHKLKDCMVGCGYFEQKSPEWSRNYGDVCEHDGVPGDINGDETPTTVPLSDNDDETSTPDNDDEPVDINDGETSTTVPLSLLPKIVSGHGEPDLGAGSH